MFKEFNINDKKIFKAVVVSTMSSGKSTFINALIGHELLLSRNEACSAQVISVLDNDNSSSDRVFVKYNNGDTKKYPQVTDELMEKINNSNDIDKILIETEIQGIKNTDRAMVIIDTPGVNNSMDATHKQKTMDLLYKINNGLIIYLLNATQLGVDDDFELLQNVAKMIKENEKLKIMFVVNKIDEIDDEKESLDDTMAHICEYLTNAGITNPQIFPVSALGAKLFRMALSGKEFTRREGADFLNLYERFKETSFNLNRYIVSDTYPDSHSKVTVRGEEYSYMDLYLAIENTGITSIEDEIEDIMAGAGKVYNPKVSMRRKK